MPATQHGRAQRHQVGDGVVPISDQLLEVAGDKSLDMGLSACTFLVYQAVKGRRSYISFCVVQLDTSCESPLGEETQLGDGELIELLASMSVLGVSPYEGWDGQAPLSGSGASWLTTCE